MARLLPNGKPRWIRVYDNGGKTCDRYFVCFTGRYSGSVRSKISVSMNCAPFHPQGICQHGESNQHYDVNDWNWAPMIGKKNHLGERISFDDLPIDCQKVVMRDYCEIWGLTLDEKSDTIKA